MQDIKIPEGPGQPGAPTIEVCWPRRDLAQIALLGEHDLATTAALEQTIDDVLLRASQLVVDVTHTEFIDSSTINTLVRAHRRAEDAGVRFNLLVGNATVVRRALEITDVLATLNTVDSLEDALRPGRADRDGSGPPDGPP